MYQALETKPLAPLPYFSKGLHTLTNHKLLGGGRKKCLEFIANLIITQNLNELNVMYHFVPLFHNKVIPNFILKNY